MLHQFYYMIPAKWGLHSSRIGSWEGAQVKLAALLGARVAAVPNMGLPSPCSLVLHLYSTIKDNILSEIAQACNEEYLAEECSQCSE